LKENFTFETSDVFIFLLDFSILQSLSPKILDSLNILFCQAFENLLLLLLLELRVKTNRAAGIYLALYTLLHFYLLLFATILGSYLFL